jgi:protein-S-isoprenylcysteine O-methyltransferase Ste14
VALTAGHLATGGAYRRIRQPRYAGFLLVRVGFLLQWPTLLALDMLAVLLLAYWRLASSEEREVRQRFGGKWDARAVSTPRLIPRLGRRTALSGSP